MIPTLCSCPISKISKGILGTSSGGLGGSHNSWVAEARVSCVGGQPGLVGGCLKTKPTTQSKLDKKPKRNHGSGMLSLHYIIKRQAVNIYSREVSNAPSGFQLIQKVNHWGEISK
jgi:hypothetical protein